MMMLIQRVTSQLAIKTALDTKMGKEGGGSVVKRGVQGGVAGGTSFRRQRGFRAKRGESIKKAKPNHSHESSDRSPWLKQRYSRINTSDLSSDESGDSGRYSDSSETCGSKKSSEDKSKELAGRGAEHEHDRSDPKTCILQSEINCKRSDHKAPNKGVMIFIDREGKHQLKQSQTVISTKQPLNGSRYSAKAIVRDSDGRVTLHVPCVGHEEIFNV